MVPTNSISVFLRHNDLELKLLVRKICGELKFQGDWDDLIQNLYLKIITGNILQSYNRHYCTGRKYSSSRMSTYLYPILRNFVLSVMMSKDYRDNKRIASYDALDYNEESLNAAVEYQSTWNFNFSEPNEKAEKTIAERFTSGYTTALNFKDILGCNDSGVDGLSFDIKKFQERFKASKFDKKFKPGKKTEKTPECTLSKVFAYIYDGYSNKEIAEIYGVSNMTITHLKQKLAAAMVSLGLTSENSYDYRHMPG